MSPDAVHRYHYSDGLRGALSAVAAPARRSSRWHRCRSAGVVKRQGEKIAILNFGTLLPEAAAVADKLNATPWICACEAAGYRADPPAGRRRRAGDAGRERHHGRRRSGVNEVLMAHAGRYRCSILACRIILFLRALRKRSAPTSALMPPVLKPKSATGWHIPFRPAMQGYP